MRPTIREPSRRHHGTGGKSARSTRVIGSWLSSSHTSASSHTSGRTTSALASSDTVASRISSPIGNRPVFAPLEYVFDGQSKNRRARQGGQRDLTPHGEDAEDCPVRIE